MKKIISLLLVGVFAASLAVTPAFAENNVSLLTIFPTVTLYPATHTTDRMEILAEVVEAAKKEKDANLIPESNVNAVYPNKGNVVMPSGDVSLLASLLG